MVDTSQLLKGVLPAVTLAVVADGETYGYAVVSPCVRAGFRLSVMPRSTAPCNASTTTGVVVVPRPPRPGPEPQVLRDYRSASGCAQGGPEPLGVVPGGCFSRTGLDVRGRTMSAQQRTSLTVDDSLQQVEQACWDLSPQMRHRLLADLEAHLREREGDGGSRRQPGKPNPLRPRT